MNEKKFRIVLDGNYVYRVYSNRQRAIARCELLASDSSVYVELWYGTDLIKYWN